MSNFLQVPSHRRDSFKSGAWDFLLHEIKSDVSSSQESGQNGDESGQEEEDCQRVGCSVKAKTDFYTTFVKEAAHVPGDAGDLVTFEEIPWIDHSLIQEGVAFHKKHFAHEIFAMMAAVIFGFAVKPASSVLMRSRSGCVTNPEEFYERHISTIYRILKFIDFHKNPNEAYDEILKIRKIHSDVAYGPKESEDQTRGDLKLDEPWKKTLVLAMQKDLDFVDTSGAPKELLIWNPTVPVSQFDMVTTQLGFWISMWLFPRFFGIKNRAEELRGIVHIWAIFGRLLGIKDEYNICLEKPDVSLVTPDLYEKLYRNVILESLKSMDESVITLQSLFIEGLRKRVPFVTYKAILYVGLQECEGYRGNNLWKLMNWRDKICVRFLQAFFLLMRHSRYFRTAVNFLLYFWFQLQFVLYLPWKKWKMSIPRYLKNSITLKLY